MPIYDVLVSLLRNKRKRLLRNSLSQLFFVIRERYLFPYFVLLIATPEWVSTVADNTQHTWGKRTDTYSGTHRYGNSCHSTKLQRHPTFWFLSSCVSREREPAKFCMAPLYSCSSIKLRYEWPPRSPHKANANTKRGLNKYGASKQNIWKIQLYARHSSIRTTFFFYLLAGH